MFIRGEKKFFATKEDRSIMETVKNFAREATTAKQLLEISFMLTKLDRSSFMYLITMI